MDERAPVLNWMDGTLPFPVENVLIQEHEYEGRVYPWFLLPFRWPTTENGTPHDYFGEQRKLYDAIRDYASVMTPRAIEELHWQLCIENPNYLIHSHLVIRDKEAKKGLFDHHNLLQRRLWWAFCAQWYEGLPVRIDVLKGRQMGASTWAQALQSALFLTRTEQYALLMSNKDTNGEAIFRMAERNYDAVADGLPAHRVPVVSQRTTQKLGLGTKRRAHQAKDGEKAGQLGPVLNNLIEVKTASATAPDIGLTINLGHFTEMCKWPTPEPTWEAISQGIPDVAGSVIIRESTAWAYGDWWHECVKSSAAGESDFVFVFNGPQDAEWRWSIRSQRWVREYSRELPAKYQHARHPEDLAVLRTQYFKSLPTELRQQAVLNKLTLEQCAWAKAIWIDKCNRSWDAFFRQYPFSWAQAFRASGRSFFTAEACEHYLNATSVENAKPPVWRGNFSMTGEGFVELDERGSGYTKMWVAPQTGGEYTIGIDGAEGDDPEGDFSVCSVWDAKHTAQVAQCVMRLEQTEFFSSQVQCLARIYNDAFCVPEVTGSAGFTITKNLQPNGQYPVENLYVRETFDSVGKQETMKWGYSVASKLKLQMLSAYRSVINAMEADLNSPLSARQAAGYIRRPDGTYGNSRRKVGNDDCVIADALAIVGINCEQRLGTTSEDAHRNGLAPATFTDAPSFMEQQLRPYDGRFRDDPASWGKQEGQTVVHPELGSCV